jgi:iron complex outermembrane receptor protein
VQMQSMSNTYEGFEFLVPQFWSGQAGVFYFLEKRWRKGWKASSAIRWDGAGHVIQKHEQPIYRNRRFTGEFEVRNPDIDRWMQNFSGSLGTSWKPNNRQEWRFHVGSSFRVPTAIELSMNGVHHGNFRHELGNATLDPERGWQADLSWTYQNKNIQINANAFASYYDRYIYLAPTGRFSPLPGAGAFWEYKQHDALFGGGELNVVYQPSPWLTLSQSGEYVQNQNLETGLPLPLTPPLLFRSRLELRLPKRYGQLHRAMAFVGYTWAADQNRTDRNERETPGYQLWDMGFSAGVTKNVTLIAGVQNLMDVAYFNHMSRYRLINLPEPGRNVYVKIILASK